jgi:hypothetical protein
MRLSDKPSCWRSEAKSQVFMRIKKMSVKTLWGSQPPPKLKKRLLAA